MRRARRSGKYHLKSLEEAAQDSPTAELDRSEEVIIHKDPITITLPVRNFLYTLDQLSYMMQVSIEHLSNYFIHFDKISVQAARSRMLAINIQSDPNSPPDWRVSEAEFIAYLRRVGFRAGNRKIIEKVT